MLGARPGIALVNEQAYSAGMVAHYLDAGYRAIVMEWDNPAMAHPEWPAEWRYLPQVACGHHGEEIPLLWNKSLAFQKFQRYAHGEIDLDEYLEYLGSHVSSMPRAFPLYGGDIEVFDFRPGRYRTEAELTDGVEWDRLRRLFESLLADDRFEFVTPSGALEMSDLPGAGNRLHLESADQPIPVKKQGKYNLTRWAVTGRDDLGVNTDCWRAYERLQADPATSDDSWRELCYLWSSDFRTHITDRRWVAFRERLASFGRQVGAGHSKNRPPSIESSRAGPEIRPETRSEGRFLTVETEAVTLVLNTRRGLAIESLAFLGVSDRALVGTLSHGYYDDISLGADFYTGHLIVEPPGAPKITDLERVQPEVHAASGGVEVSGVVPTPYGPVRKMYRLVEGEPASRAHIRARLDRAAGGVVSSRPRDTPARRIRSRHFVVLESRWRFDARPVRTIGHLGRPWPPGLVARVGNRWAWGDGRRASRIGDARHAIRVEVDKSCLP